MKITSRVLTACKAQKGPKDYLLAFSQSQAPNEKKRFDFVSTFINLPVKMNKFTFLLLFLDSDWLIRKGES